MRLSGETCPACASRAGVTARIVPRRRRPREAREAKPRRGKTGQVGGGVTDRSRQESAGSAAKATQGAEAHPREKRRLTGAEAGVWTERMLSALGNGVQGGKGLLRRCWTVRYHTAGMLRDT